MRKVVHINTKRFLGGYSSAQKSERIPSDVVFLVGVVTTLVGVATTTVIPVVTYCANGGPVSPLVFASVALPGSVIGLIKYRLLPSDVVTRLNVGNVTQTPSGDVSLKQAS